MIKNPLKLKEFYRESFRKEKLSYKKALAIFEALRHEAVSLGKFNSKNILEGIEVNIKLAKILNSKGNFHG